MSFGYSVPLISLIEQNLLNFEAATRIAG